MHTHNQISHLCQHFSLSKEALKFIKSIRSSELTLRPRSARGNVSGRYPGLKMKSSIQLESYRRELSYLYQIEHDTQVLEFYDQPSF